METIHMSGRTMDHGICVLFFKSACQIGAYVYNKRRAYGRCGLMSCRVDFPLHQLQILRQRILTRPLHHKLINVPQRTIRNLHQRLLREKRLMPRHNHIVKRHQPHQHIIMNNLPRMIIIKQRTLTFVNIQRNTPQMLRLESPNHSLRINKPSSGSIDQHRTRLHLRNRLLVDNPPRAIHQRAMQADHVRLSKNLIKRLILSNPFKRRRRKRIVRQDPTPKPLHDLRRRNPNLPRANKPNRLPKERSPHQPVQREIPLPRPVVRAVRLAVQRLDQRNRKLRHGLRRIRRHVGDHDAGLFGRHEVDVVEARAAQQNRLDAFLR